MEEVVTAGMVGNKGDLTHPAVFAGKNRWSDWWKNS